MKMIRATIRHAAWLVLVSWTGTAMAAEEGRADFITTEPIAQIRLVPPKDTGQTEENGCRPNYFYSKSFFASRLCLRSHVLRCESCAAAVAVDRPSGSRRRFPKTTTLDQHQRYLLMAPCKERAGTLGFRCVADRNGP